MYRRRKLGVRDSMRVRRDVSFVIAGGGGMEVLVDSRRDVHCLVLCLIDWRRFHAERKSLFIVVMQWSLEKVLWLTLSLIYDYLRYGIP